MLLVQLTFQLGKYKLNVIFKLLPAAFALLLFYGTVLSYVQHLFCTPTKEHRETVMGEGGAQIIPCPGYSKAHLHSSRRAQNTTAGRNPNCRLPETNTISGPFPGLPCESLSPLCPGKNPITMSHREQLSGSPFKCCQGMGHMMGCRGRAFFDCTGFTIGFIRGGTKGRKREGLGVMKEG